MSVKNGEKNKIQPSTLYLVATPIGNLEDITLRALKVLGGVQLIAAEDTRNTLKMLTHYGIKAAKLVSCFEHNEARRTGEILGVLKGGGAMALVTDAGMPCISDPGRFVVNEALKGGFGVVPLPGASALLGALAASGFPAEPFTYLGFPPAAPKERMDFLVKLRSEERTLVFYESPHRLKASLKDMLSAFGDRKAVVARELTKLHEQFHRGSLEGILESFKEDRPLGEITLVVEGAEHRDRTAQENWSGVSIEDQITQMMGDQKLSKTEAVKAVCKLRGLPREVVYQIAVKIPSKIKD